MTGQPLDRELLEAFVPEFAAGLARLEAADTSLAATRILDGLQAMAGALGLAALGEGLEAAATATEPFDGDALSAAVASLRRQVAAITGEAASPEAPPAEPSAAVIRTLVVDDSPTMRRILAGVLARDPAFTVVGEAADGAEALNAMTLLLPDLIMLDLEMPVLDGFGFLRHWALAGHGAVVVVSSAAPPGSAAARMLRRLGASGIVGKPTGALSFDLAEKRGDAILAAARHAAGLPC